MARLMLDTNVFNRVVDGRIALDAFAGHDLFATHIQTDEINRTVDPERRQKLRETFSAVAPEHLATSSAVFDVSKWDDAGWGGSRGLFEPMLCALNARNGGKANNSADILIAETAFESGLILVTDDVDLRSVAHEFGFDARISTQLPRI